MTTPRIPPKIYKYKGNHKPKHVTNPKHVYFRDVQPMVLKEQLTGRDSSGKRTPCVGQMLEMLDCLKRTGFIDGPCKQQITAFTKCNEDFKKAEIAKHEEGEEDITNFKSTKDMRREQLNLLLKRFHTKT